MAPKRFMTSSSPTDKWLKRRCGSCKQEGHDRRNCSQRNNATISPVPPPSPSGPSESHLPPITNFVHEVPVLFSASPTLADVQLAQVVNGEQTGYVILDIETTGGSRTDDDIIEIAAMMVAPDGGMLEEGSFDTLVKPEKQVSTFITASTGITNEMVMGAPTFPIVATNLFDFITANFEAYRSTENKHITNIILVAHNANRFDIPLLLRSLEKYQLMHLWSDNPKLGFTIDTLDMARRVFQDSKGKPVDNNIGTLYQLLIGRDLQDSYRAVHNVKALYSIFRHPKLWTKKVEFVKSFKQQDQILLPTNDSDDDPATDDFSLHGVEDMEEYGTEEGEEDDADDTEGDQLPACVFGDTKGGDTDHNEQGPLAHSWTRGDFVPIGSSPQQLFTQHLKSNSPSHHIRTGLQVPNANLNSPIKAWSAIFTASILENIVRHTNAYGELHAKRWTPVTEKDLTDFISVLFVMSTQRRKDKPSNWFSSNPILESKVAKRICSARKFGVMLRYLHCCDPLETGMTEQGEYDPSYKVSELMRSLEQRYNSIFVPSQQLSLDQNLSRSFGQIKFKVRIVSKAARYRIKIYVVADARTSFVLKVLIYTGKYACNKTKTESTKTTLQAVQELCDPYRGSYRTIYVDRFHTSVDLLKQLEDMKLYITGILMSDRIPKELTVAKMSATFKSMARGDVQRHVLNYKTESSNECKAGLVSWKDKNMVYCLTNDTSTVLVDHCTRRTQGGLVQIARPNVITKYNEYMGGVDVAGIHKFHCTSTIMGQNRWWLKLFFYLLDVGTSNALVLYNEAMGDKKKPLNITEFKLKVIEALVGLKLKDSPTKAEATIEHNMVKLIGNNRQRCSYCALKSIQRRTRYMCEACGVPYCSIGSGKTSQDCFAMAHDNEYIREICVQKYATQQRHTQRKFRVNK